MIYPLLCSRAALAVLVVISSELPSAMSVIGEETR